MQWSFQKIIDTWEQLTPWLALASLVGSGILFLAGQPQLAEQLLRLCLVIGVMPFVVNMSISLWRREFGVDLIAVVGMLSSILIGEYLAGTVILLMLSGGEALEHFALQRARKELTELLAGAPTIAHLKTNQQLQDIAVDDVNIGDIVLVKPGEVIPVDGIVMSGKSNVNESAITGESLPVEKAAHSIVLSGSINTDYPIEMKALRLSHESKYQQIIALVREAEKQKAPFVRLADRYSVWFTATAFGLAGLGWLLSGDPARALAVLVVATPCPLILATPIAFASGISRAAKRGIIIKEAGAIEKMARARSFIFDKTGTLTMGVPVLHLIHGFGDGENKTETRTAGAKKSVDQQQKIDQKYLKIAASIDQFSTHILAEALMTAAHKLKLHLLYPENFTEVIGNGVSATIEKQTWVLGKLSYLESLKIPVGTEIKKFHQQHSDTGKIVIYLAKKSASSASKKNNSKIMAGFAFEDEPRPHLKKFFTELAGQVTNILMATGDKKSVAEKIAHQVGIQHVLADALPEDKVAAVRTLQKTAGPVVMVGDGINDAPALSAADVGITVGGRGATAASEAGDIVIMVDNFERIGEARLLSKKVMRIATQCILIGIGLSTVLMFFAMLGFIKPIYGAMLQEVIDVIVILNALRVYIQPRDGEPNRV